METNLTQVEKDFIEFIAQKRKRPYEEIKGVFLAIKEQFNFFSQEYRDLCGKIHNLFSILYDDSDEQSLAESYKFHALIHLFRGISYSYPRAESGGNFFYYFRAFAKALAKGEFGKLFDFAKRKIFKKSDAAAIAGDYGDIAKFLTKQISGRDPVVADYGCGLGYISFEIGKLNRNAKVYLVDIDCMLLEFTEFRFKKHGMNAEVIKIDKDNLYPKLPAHNICIATEVMEHIARPMEAYENIYKGLETGGLLYGNFEDHRKEMFHISTDLSELRKKISENFEKINSLCYKKIK